LFSPTTKIKKKFDVKFVKKIKPKGKKVLWKEYDINTLVNKERLTSPNQDVMMFKSELTKYFFCQKNKIFMNRSAKWCILTKIELIIFPSKENFLKLQKPSMKIQIDDITDYGRLDPLMDKEKIKFNKDTFYFFLKLNEMEAINKSQEKIERKENQSPVFILPSLQYEINKIKNKSPVPQKNNRISLISNKVKTQQLIEANLQRKNKNIYTKEEGEMHIWSSNNEELVNKWVFLIDYIKNIVK
jgi:hypothetical protein